MFKSRTPLSNRRKNNKKRKTRITACLVPLCWVCTPVNPVQLVAFIQGKTE